MIGRRRSVGKRGTTLGARTLPKSPVRTGSCARHRSDKAKSDSLRNEVDWECTLARFQPLDDGPHGTAAVLVPAVRYYYRRLGCSTAYSRI